MCITGDCRPPPYAAPGLKTDFRIARPAPTDGDAEHHTEILSGLFSVGCCHWVRRGLISTSWSCARAGCLGGQPPPTCPLKNQSTSSPTPRWVIRALSASRGERIR